jgi:hypothetical protein
VGKCNPGISIIPLFTRAEQQQFTLQSAEPVGEMTGKMKSSISDTSMKGRGYIPRTGAHPATQNAFQFPAV